MAEGISDYFIFEHSLSFYVLTVHYAMNIVAVIGGMHATRNVCLNSFCNVIKSATNTRRRRRCRCRHRECIKLMISLLMKTQRMK